jgi:hypothetical protein
LSIVTDRSMRSPARAEPMSTGRVGAFTFGSGMWICARSKETGVGSPSNDFETTEKL